MANTAATPQRYQLSRAKGARLPPNTVSVARPHKFGNPFDWKPLKALNKNHTNGTARAEAVRCFENWINGSDKDWMGPRSREVRAFMLASIPDLRNKNVACYCPIGAVCHGDILLKLAAQVGVT